MLVYLDRNGVVLEVAIGSIASISLPELHLRRNLDRLSGYRCIHTHPGGDARLSDVDVQALRLLRFDSMCSVGVAENRATGIMAAFLGEAEYDRLSIVTFGPVKPGRIPQNLWMREIEAAEERVKRAIERGGLTETAERAMLISTDSEDSLDELAALAAVSYTHLAAAGRAAAKDVENGALHGVFRQFVVAANGVRHVEQLAVTGPDAGEKGAQFVGLRGDDVGHASSSGRRGGR